MSLVHSHAHGGSQMEPVTITLLIISLGLAALCVWMFISRGGAAAAYSAQAALGARLEQDLIAAKEDVERARADGRAREKELATKYDSLAAETVKVVEERATLAAELQGQEKQSQSDLSDLAMSAEQNQRHMAERFETELSTARERSIELIASVKREAETTIKSERETLEAQRVLFKDARRELEERISRLNEQTKAAFTHTAQQVLADATTALVKMADAKHAAANADMEKRQVAVEVMVKPIGESLKKTAEKLGEIERDRAESFGKLSEQLRGVSETNVQLRDQTGRLVNALKRPEVRGRWGEMQLERLVELSGMKAYSDFKLQHSSPDSEGKLQRPDLIVTMSNLREVVVDAKTNIGAFVDAIDTADTAEKEMCLDRFADHVVAQIAALSKKNYWSQYEGSPEFVVMFIPGEQFLDEALRRRPQLLDAAASAGIILATPSTLIGLLKVVALGWREKRIEDQAKEFVEGRPFKF